MRIPRLLALLLALLPAVLLAPACGGGGGGGSEPPPTPGLVLGEVPAAWLLADLNPASPTYAQAVGPVPSQGRASAWYFGHAT